MKWASLNGRFNASFESLLTQARWCGSEWGDAITIEFARTPLCVIPSNRTALSRTCFVCLDSLGLRANPLKKAPGPKLRGAPNRLKSREPRGATKESRTVRAMLHGAGGSLRNVVQGTASAFALQEPEQVSDSSMVLKRMPKRNVAVEHVVISSPAFLAFKNSSIFQLNNDSLDRSFGDSDIEGDVSQSRVGIA